MLGAGRNVEAGNGMLDTTTYMVMNETTYHECCVDVALILAASFLNLLHSFSFSQILNGLPHLGGAICKSCFYLLFRVCTL